MSELRQPKTSAEEVGNATKPQSGPEAGDDTILQSPRHKRPKIPFTRQAARASWVAPLLSLVLSYYIKPLNPTFNLLMLMVMVFFLIAGFVFGIVALFGIRKHGRKGILKPAIAGIIVNVSLISLFISLWVFFNVVDKHRLQQEGEKMGMDVFLNYPGWFGATFVEGAVLTVTSIDDMSEAAREFNTYFIANVSHLLISVDNSAGKEDFDVNPSMVRLILEDGRIENALSTRQVLQTARVDKQKWIDTYTGPFRVYPGEQLTNCIVFLPYGFDMSKVEKVIVNINGQDTSVAGSYLTAEQKAKLVKSGLEGLEHFQSLIQSNSNQSEMGDQNIFVPVADDVLLINVGIETYDALVESIFTAGSKLPLLKREIFSTAVDDQQTVDVHVLQGFRPLSKYNRTLARLQLTQLPRAPRGVPQIEITFDIDRNGLLSISAIEKSINKKASVVFLSSETINPAEAEKMRQEANRYSQQDSAEVKLIETRNQAELMLYVAEHYLLPSLIQRSILKGLMAKVKSHLADQSPEQLISQMNALQVYMEEITGKKYILESGVFVDEKEIL